MPRSTTQGVAINLPGTPQIRAQGRILVPADPFRPHESLAYLESWFVAIREMVNARLNESSANPALWDDFGFAIELPDVS
jgi:hypothetical protein